MFGRPAQQFGQKGTGKFALPPPKGQTVGYWLPAGERVYAIGDIHGHLKQLRKLHDRIAFDCSRHTCKSVTLIYLGDYVDRGPSSAQVLDLVLQHPNWATNVVRLLGNHEMMFRDFMNEGQGRDVFPFNGGPATMASYGIIVPPPWPLPTRKAIAQAARKVVPTAHIALLDSEAYCKRIGGFFFCHAGVWPGEPLSKQKPEQLLWIKESFLNSTVDFGCMVVHGHSRTIEPELRPNRINVDTGCYDTGRLTAVAIEDNQVRFLQVSGEG